MPHKLLIGRAFQQGCPAGRFSLDIATLTMCKVTKIRTEMNIVQCNSKEYHREKTEVCGDVERKTKSTYVPTKKHIRCIDTGD